MNTTLKESAQVFPLLLILAIIVILLDGLSIFNVIDLSRLNFVSYYDMPKPAAHGKEAYSLEPSSDHVALRFDDHNYDITSDHDWESIFPSNGNDYHVSMYRQLACLDTIRRAHLILYARQSNTSETPLLLKEAQWCFGYLRQIILCNADTTLEPSVRVYDLDDVFLQDATGLGEYHRCYDWTRIRHIEIPLSNSLDTGT
ncbi:uncharacterized protein EV420DRAFT_1552163 [Desarmillaria tabescens]|uniref:Uncharacterized protein n=1 Tax=Armillaria tabescens TaxID=1929756 RepID=A0AA39N388_ARMTA|nr:uncharacterized protein EV420DRAFT_1552163 [Desarmillaria tabescens]KAK0455600.1 hypothetical protein EV420DRAFT_1552163 [Desarmillaria tabescens]